ncbi:hypothetical protein HDU98_004026, partial [Podochytrium sp. JEL0797]
MAPKTPEAPAILTKSLLETIQLEKDALSAASKPSVQALPQRAYLESVIPILMEGLKSVAKE